MIFFVMENVLIHELVDLVQVEKGNHGVAVVLSMVVRVPKKRTNKEVGADTASVAKTVGFFGHFAVGVLEVANKVDDGVAKQNGNNPPKEDTLKTLTRLTKSGKNGNVDNNLGKGSHLKLTHDAAFLPVRPLFETPSSAAVVHWNAHCRESDASNAALEGVEDIKKLAEVRETAERQVSKTRVVKLFARVIGSQLRILSSKRMLR